MSLEVINNGAYNNDPSSDSIRTAFGKCNDNFSFLSGYSLIVPPSGGDDTVAIQTAINSLSQANGGRGGTVQLVAGIYNVLSSILITSQGNIRILGASPCADQIANNAAGSIYQYGATSILYSGPSGTPCFEVLSAGPVSGWSTIGICLQDFAVLNNSKTTHGIKAVQNPGGQYQYDLWIKGCFIGGGDRQLWLTGTDTFNIFIDGLECGYFKYVADAGSELEKYGNFCVASDLTNGPGIASQFMRLRCLGARKNLIYLAGRQYGLKLQSCTFESSQLAAIRAVGTNLGELILDHCHFEANGQGAYWNGTYYQQSVSDNSPVGYIEIGSSPGQNQPGQTAIVNCDASLANINDTASAAHVFPLVVAWDGATVTVDGGTYAPNNGFNQGQPYIRRENFETHINLRNVLLQPMSGATQPIGGAQGYSMRNISIDNCPGFGNYPLVQPTDSATYQELDFRYNRGAAISALVRQDLANGSPGTPPLANRREFFATDLTYMGSGDWLKHVPYMEGDTIWFHSAWQSLTAQGVFALICTTDNVTTYSATQWVALRGAPINIFNVHDIAAINPVPIDCSNGVVFQVYCSTNAAVTINNPINLLYNGQEISINIRNESGGAMGTITWGNAYRFQTSTQPAAPTTGTSNTIRFFWDPGSSTWIEMFRTSGNVPH